MRAPAVKARSGCGRARVLGSELMTAERALGFYPVMRGRLWPPELSELDGVVWPEFRS